MSTQHTLLDHTEPTDQTLGTTSTGNPLEPQNIHATGTLNQEFELKALLNDLDTAEDYIEQHGFIRITYNDLPGSIQLWNTGSFAITGITTLDDLSKIESWFLDELRQLGIDISDTTHASVSNYVATLTLTTTNRLNLNSIAVALGLENVEYEPDRFPGLLYRPEPIDGVCLIFGSGNILITGVTDRETVTELAEHVESRLTELALI